jgi:hypothetical protein
MGKNRETEKYCVYVKLDHSTLPVTKGPAFRSGFHQHTHHSSEL